MKEKLMRVNSNFAAYLNSFSTWDEVLVELPSATTAKSAMTLVQELMARHPTPTTVVREIDERADRSTDPFAGELSESFARFLNAYEDWRAVKEYLPRFTRAPGARKLVDRLSRTFPSPAMVLHASGGRQP